MNDWTEEAQVAINLCENWARKIISDVPAQVFLFGSAIYKGGEQFDADQSDLDLVVLLREPLGIMERIEALQRLHRHKWDLEVEMVRTLKRSSCIEPGASIIPITEFELRTNIHKNGARRFFDKNFFYDLLAQKESLGIPMAGTLFLDDESRYAIEHVQRIRNEYLSVCANGTGGLDQFNGRDPLPKSLLRSAAQLEADVDDGEWYDTRLGLETVFSALRERKADDPAIRRLFDTVSVRRGGRGRVKPLTPEDQLLLAEVLFELAKRVNTDRVVTWEIRISGSDVHLGDLAQITSGLRRLVSDAQILQIRQGSLILVIRGSLSGYRRLQRLNERNALAAVLDVETCVLGPIEEQRGQPEQTSNDPDFQSRLVYGLSKWSPSARLREKQYEDEFAVFLGEIATASRGIVGPEILRSVTVVDTARTTYEFDFLVRWQSSEGQQNEVGIEFKVVRSPSTFFQTLQRLLSLRRSIILVVLAPAELIAAIQADISRLSLVNRQVQVVAIAIDKKKDLTPKAE